AFNESAKVRITKVLDMSAPLEGVSLAPLYPNLHSANDELQRVTSRLLMAQGDPVMLEPLVELCAAYIRDDPDTPEELLDHAGCTHALARIGHRAAKFAPHIADLIERASGHAPTDAVEMLGFLGNDQVSPQLVRLLDSADDRIVTSALEAIWRLDAQSALLAVELVARRHWYGPVREFAARVAMALTGGDSAPVQEALALDSHEERLTGKHIWGLPLYSRVPGNRNCAHWRSGLDRGEFLPNAPADLQDAAAHIHRAVTAVRFGNGSLVGVHHGEFGGGLVFVKKGNPDHRISPENVNALIELGDGDVAALLGLAHLIDSGGWVVVLRADAMGVPDIVERIRLPSAPHGARLEGERWLVPMANGHAVWISRDLSLTQATCAAEDQVER
ncbi:MAG TPA: hypothetical protein PKZ76_12475, partial [Xanthomonadaceae bacterium]|nr:hypothetical protein [Xanthomonadaceae bacterium]